MNSCLDNISCLLGPSWISKCQMLNPGNMKDCGQVVEENKRQLCVFQQAKEIDKPWLWWEFVSNYGSHCTFKNGKFNDVACAQTEVEAIGLSQSKVLECIEHSFVDAEHALLKVSGMQAHKPLGDIWFEKIAPYYAAAPIHRAWCMSNPYRVPVSAQKHLSRLCHWCITMRHLHGKALW